MFIDFDLLDTVDGLYWKSNASLLLCYKCYFEYADYLDEKLHL